MAPYLNEVAPKSQIHEVMQRAAVAYHAFTRALDLFPF